MFGYKATDKDGKCKDIQFDLPKNGKPGKWHKFDGELKMCEAGFHFCEYPSGPWCYYSEHGTRIWKIEAEDVAPEPHGYGAEKKRVCKKIRLVEEIIPDGNRNTGNRNTGDRNTGNRNTGYWNTGDGNTGDRNTGDRNTGNRNTGYWNTGDGNTGYWNTGDGNTGNRNTGDGNTGYGNTGNRNTGDGNATNRAAGFFCQEIQTIKVFDVDSGLTYEDFTARFPNYYRLGELLLMQEEINFDDWKDLPGITPEKLKSLHEKHLAGRK